MTISVLSNKEKKLEINRSDKEKKAYIYFSFKNPIVKSILVSIEVNLVFTVPESLSFVATERNLKTN